MWKKLSFIGEYASRSIEKRASTAVAARWIGNARMSI